MIREICKAIIRKTPLIALDYPIEPTPRWGFGKPPHRQLNELIGASSAQYRSLFGEFAGFREAFLSLPEQSSSPHEPSRVNAFFSGLDAYVLYSLIRLKRPRVYCEIGSGNSTRFAARAVRDGNTGTRLTSIDPHPRAEMDSLAHSIVRQPLEAADQAVFATLAAGDILFFDGSHYCLQNSDVVTFFLEILPVLPAGVLVHVHDIRLPYDYPPKLRRHWYAEQYLLAMYLLSSPRPRILFPNYWIWEQPELRSMVNSVCDVGGNSFWFES